AAVEVGRQAEHESLDRMLPREIEQTLRIVLELGAPDRLERRADRARDVAEREPECLGARVDADQPAGREARHEVRGIADGDAAWLGLGIVGHAVKTSESITPHYTAPRGNGEPKRPA